jgi:membrane fusion protein (multidrug efflux system)
MNSSRDTAQTLAANDLPGNGAASARALLIWGICALLLITVGAIAGFIPRHHHREALRSTTRDLAIPTVTVVSPVTGKISVAPQLPADIRAFTDSPIYARANGYLKKWHVDIGAEVKSGQLLAEIETPELDQDLAHSRAELKQSEAALDLSKTTAKRWAELVKTASVSEQESAEKQADLALKTATVEASRAGVRRLEELKSFARVTAPFEGTITARRTDTGELIRTDSGRELFHLAQTKTLRVYVRVPQAAARSIKAGHMAELTIPELPGKVFKAKVVRTSGAMTPESRTLLTELEVDNSEGQILAGSYAQVQLVESSPEAPITLPSNTLLFRTEGPHVAVVGEQGRIELRRISLGRDFGPTIEILSGISSSDRVVLNPPDSLVNGMTVRLAQAEKQ